MRTELTPINPAEHVSLVTGVYETILEAIIAGRLASGSVLSELALARDLVVSRTPVHDALRQLAKDGLVEQSSGHRARVAPFARNDVFEVFEIRKLLEGAAAELAAGRMDERQLVPLRQQTHWLAENPQAIDWVAQWADHDEDLHRSIAESSGNRRLAADISRNRLLHRGLNRLGTDSATLQTALAEHQKIIAALAKHDGAAARNAMLAHISHWQMYFMERFPRG